MSMEVQVQSGYKVKYKLWSDWKVYEKVVEGSVRYKKINTSDVWPTYKFYDKKGHLIYAVEKAEIHFIERIFTTVMQEERTSVFRRILNLIKKEK